ncbi:MULTISPECIES: LysE family translocator [unclassified Paenibacillus]|uniref:LysE family translocator n=1 Tax=unclassified Paenibacillus TaxID=185978 RepID=UPI0009A68A43|nr:MULTISPECIES: LysE family transporter [unclassified Paenibacillus]SLK10066.1 Threonine/homoserine/homoserine lactone efflux protein [Paenibacillus sp. RU5A]SOC71849.1 Threonine/homoserine/homoserine lactone efflux protein [Paenibacillus sp. RU26A]SOC74205.1 Threonine/homoserine/homoserine lactone efflux protein [Paenibacillus sp. RU5M]
MNIVAFLTYVIVTSITPGPSNILMMNEARKFGFIGSWRFNGGILAGFGLLGIISGVFTTSLYHWLPVVGPYFEWAGAAYMLYLVWLMMGNKSSEKDSRDVQSSFLSGVMLQLINVKSILFFLTVMSAFILPSSPSGGSLVIYLSLSILLGWLSLLVWSGFGSMFKTFLTVHDRSFRLLMCLLLTYSAIRIFI